MLFTVSKGVICIKYKYTFYFLTLISTCDYFKIYYPRFILTIKILLFFIILNGCILRHAIIAGEPSHGCTIYLQKSVVKYNTIQYNRFGQLL